MGAGYAAVWPLKTPAKPLWDAMKRKEVYGTSGTRMTVRFFGAGITSRRRAQPRRSRRRLRQGRTHERRPLESSGGQGPTFLVAAAKDPLFGNLESHPDRQGLARQRTARRRKRCTTSCGATRRRHKPGKDGKLPSVGNTVDVATATWTNSIGDPELATVVERPGLRSLRTRLLLRTRDRRSRRRGGLPTTRCASASRWRRRCR